MADEHKCFGQAVSDEYAGSLHNLTLDLYRGWTLRGQRTQQQPFGTSAPFLCELEWTDGAYSTVMPQEDALV